MPCRPPLTLFCLGSGCAKRSEGWTPLRTVQLYAGISQVSETDRAGYQETNYVTKLQYSTGE